MRKFKVSATVGCILLSFLSLPNPSGFARSNPQALAPAPAAAFELQDGDRVVFLGNSLFENDLPYGYLELALTTRWPNRNVTYRNIGWNGDTVWGDARSYITNPPTAYDLLIQQLTNAKPTVVFIAYGGIEAQEGEAGLPRFNQGLNKLLDKIEQLGAKAVLLSPIPVMSDSNPEEVAKRNAMLQRYAADIAKTASARGQQYIDVFSPIQARSKQVSLSDNGVHLNEAGYYYLASTIQQGLGLAPQTTAVTIDASKKTIAATVPAKLVEAGKDKGSLRFTLNDSYLPLPLPQQQGTAAQDQRILKITGLKKGYYTLTADGAQVITASANKWKEGVAISSGAPFSQASQLRERIVKKNDLYFQQYRPQNRTYIVGFRSYEQGRHTKTLEDLNFIITWLEAQIALNRTPKSNVYQLTQVK